MKDQLLAIQWNLLGGTIQGREFAVLGRRHPQQRKLFCPRCENVCVWMRVSSLKRVQFAAQKEYNT